MSSRLANPLLLAALIASTTAAAGSPPVPQADKGFVCTDKYDRKSLVVQAFERALRNSDNQVKPVIPSSWNDFKNPEDSIAFDLKFIGDGPLMQVEVRHLPQIADKLLTLNPSLKQQLSASIPALLCMRTKPGAGPHKLFVQLVGVGAVEPFAGTPVEIDRKNNGIITATVGALGLTWSRDITRLKDEVLANAAQ